MADAPGTGAVILSREEAEVFMEQLQEALSMAPTRYVMMILTTDDQVANYIHHNIGTLGAPPPPMDWSLGAENLSLCALMANPRNN